MSDTRHCWLDRVAIFAMLICMTSVADIGCSPRESAPVPNSKPNGSSDAQPKPAARADQAVRQTLDRLQRQEARALWEFLPPSYRHDVQTLARDIANRLNEPAWQPFVSTLTKARQVLARRGDLLSGPESDRDPQAASSVSLTPAAIARLRRLLDVIGDSELGDLSRLRTIEVDRFLDKTGGELLTTFGRVVVGAEAQGSTADPFARFGEVEIELASSSAERAVVKVRWPGQPPTEHDFVCVEEHWLPRTLAEAWPIQFPAVREQCLAWADELREHPESWHARLREIDQLLDELDATHTPTAARKVWQDGIVQLLWTWSQSSALPDTAPQPNPAPQSNADTPGHSPAKPARVKRPDTEVLLPDER